MPAGNGTTSTATEARAALRGRVKGLGALDDLLHRARQGSGGVLDIRGEAGLGKTALLSAARMEATGFLVLQARGVAPESGLPFAGLHQLLTPLIDPCDLSDIVSHDNAFAVYAAVTGLLAEAADRRPVLCCADDVEFLDSMSREALLFAARRLTGHAIVMLFAGAPGPPTELPRLTLEPLEDCASRQVLDDQIPDGLPQDVSEELVSLASGNPLALVELTTTLTPEQLAGAAPAPASLPAHSKLRRHFRQRFEQLSPDARRLILMAVADEWLDVDTVVRAATEAGIDLHALEEATSSGLIRVRGQHTEVPSRLIRSSLYADAPLADRHTTHQLLADVLDSEQRRLQALWHRAVIAPRPSEKLADELDEAAATARRSKDYESSSRAYQQAAALTPQPDAKALRLVTAARDFWLAGHTQRSRALLRRLRPITENGALRGLADLLQGEIELRDGAPTAGIQSLLDAAGALGESNLPLAITALMRAGEASFAAGNYDIYFATAERVTALRHTDEPPLLQFMFDHFTGLAASLRGKHDQAREPLTRAVELAGVIPGAAPKIWASLAALVLGDDHRAHDLAAQAVSGARGEGNGVLTPLALEFLAHAALRLDHYSSAVTSSVEGLRLAQVAGQHNSAINHTTMLALIAGLQGDKKTTLLRLETAAEEAAARGLARPAALSSWALACLDLTEDRPADALARLRPVLTGADSSEPFVRIMATPQFIEAALRCDERKMAATAMGIFDDWACSTAKAGHLALSQRCQALLAEGTEANERFREALRLHRRGDRPFELAKTELFYGELLRRSRKPRAAREHLRNAWKTFQRFEAVYWADRARAELRAAGEAVEPATPATTGDLTPQQAQISRLVAEGATNREIAAQLFISPRTVEHHLRNIFAKLGIRSRVELTAFFRDH